MKVIKEAGRVLFALPMIIFGVLHFVSSRSMQNVVPSFVPGDTFWVFLTGAALISAGISILLKKKTMVVCHLLGVMLLIFVFLIHLPLALEGDLLARTSLLKDIALAGAAFVIGSSFKSN